MIIKEINQTDSLNYIVIIIWPKMQNSKSINKLNAYVLHTINENYYLKSNEKDLKVVCFLDRSRKSARNYEMQ